MIKIILYGMSIYQKKNKHIPSLFLSTVNLMTENCLISALYKCLQLPAVKDIRKNSYPDFCLFAN